MSDTFVTGPFGQVDPRIARRTAIANQLQATAFDPQANPFGRLAAALVGAIAGPGVAAEQAGQQTQLNQLFNRALARQTGAQDFATRPGVTRPGAPGAQQMVPQLPSLAETLAGEIQPQMQTLPATPRTPPMAGTAAAGGAQDPRMLLAQLLGGIGGGGGPGFSGAPGVAAAPGAAVPTPQTAPFQSPQFLTELLTGGAPVGRSLELAGALRQAFTPPRDQLVEAGGRAFLQSPTGQIREIDDPTALTFDQQLQLRRAGAQQQTINVAPNGVRFPKLPPEFAYRRDSAGNVLVDDQGMPEVFAIPGTDAARERTEEQETRIRREFRRATYADIVTDDIDLLQTLVNEQQITGVGSLLNVIPGTAARDAEALIETIGANIGFERLQQMRESSPTGGALGQITEREREALQATLGNISLSQTRRQLLRNLRRLRRQYLELIHGPDAEPTLPTPRVTPQAPDEAPRRRLEDLTAEQLRALSDEEILELLR